MHEHAGETGAPSLNRRDVLKGMGAVGAGAAGITATSESAEAGFLFGDCLADWPEGLETRIDVRDSEPTEEGSVPGSGDLVLFVHGWLSDEIFGDLDVDGSAQAAGFEQALDEEGVDAHLVPVMWDSMTTWTVAKWRADDAGETLARWLEANADNYDSVSVFGHSLGTRVALVALDKLADTDVTLDEVGLLSGAVDPESICGQYDRGIDSSVEGTVYSYHSEDDPMVCTLYGIRELGSAVGCEGKECDDGGWFSDPDEPPENYEDVDLSDRVLGHCNFYKAESMDFDGESAVPELVDRQLAHLTNGTNPEDDESSEDDSSDTEDSGSGGDGPGFTMPAVLAGVGGAAAAQKLRGSGEADN